MPNPAPDVPQELVQAVLDFCDKPTVLKCALVCRIWVPSSRYNVFSRKTIEVDTKSAHVFAQLLANEHCTLTPYIRRLGHIPIPVAPLHMDQLLNVNVSVEEGHKSIVETILFLCAKWDMDMTHLSLTLAKNFHYDYLRWEFLERVSQNLEFISLRVTDIIDLEGVNQLLLRCQQVKVLELDVFQAVQKVWFYDPQAGQESSSSNDFFNLSQLRHLDSLSLRICFEPIWISLYDTLSSIPPSAPLRKLNIDIRKVGKQNFDVEMPSIESVDRLLASDRFRGASDNCTLRICDLCPVKKYNIGSQFKTCSGSSHIRTSFITSQKFV